MTGPARCVVRVCERRKIVCRFCGWAAAVGAAALTKKSPLSLYSLSHSPVQTAQVCTLLTGHCTDFSPVWIYLLFLSVLDKFVFCFPPNNT